MRPRRFTPLLFFGLLVLGSALFWVVGRHSAASIASGAELGAMPLMLVLLIASAVVYLMSRAISRDDR